MIPLPTPSQPARSFWRGISLPEPGWVVGYAALMDHFQLTVPIPPVIAMVAERYEPESPKAEFLVFGQRRLPDPGWPDHLEFAIKEEGVRLGLLKALFCVIPREEMTHYVLSAPLGKYVRRLWFLYEWLGNEPLDVPDVSGRPQAVDILDSEQQVAFPNGPISRRHRVRNNLPGSPAFCPLVWRTTSIRRHESMHYDRMARHVLDRTHPDLISRAAAFLLLSDSRSSFEIEGERPSPDRTRRWGQAIAEAGQTELSVEELIRLQQIVIGDDRFVFIGLRNKGGFVGTRDRSTHEPLPEHISAKAPDLVDLVDGLIAFADKALDGQLDPVHAAASLAFGFIYIHPFEDGNGRIHRWLIHHVLARAGYNPPGIPFPVSAAILRNVDAYREVLRSYSARLLPFIEWSTTPELNVEVINETADFYRYFDATAHAEFLFRCVQETVERDVPNEVRLLHAFDRFERELVRVIDMPRDTIDLLFRFLGQGDGRLSRRARTREFKALTTEEIERIEVLYADAMENPA